MAYGMLHASGAPVTEPMSGLPVSFDTLEEARDYREPGFTICRIVETSRAADGIEFVPLTGD